jgi:ribonucleoside-diphosphate reductase alpha chain
MPTDSSEAAAPPAASEANPSTTETPKATAVAAEPAAPAREELSVIATSGLGNGHAGNGNGKANGNGGGASTIKLNLGATKVSFQTQADAPSCADCGSIMVRNGSCYKCLNCGSTSGCS